MTTKENPLIQDSPKEQTEYQFEAFISYSHEDKKTAEWLGQFLSDYWVPGFGKRKIFLDRHSLKSDGGLNHSIKEGLKKSKYLVVCCSEHAKASEWVDLEVNYFLEFHSPSYVLACSVGDIQEQRPVPNSILELEKNMKDVLLKPDLRTYPNKKDKQRKDFRRSEALTLLASILELSDKNAILDKRKKRRVLAVAAVSILILVLLTALFTYKWWLNSPNGYKFLALQSVLNTALTNRVDHPKYMATAATIAKHHGQQNLEKFAQIYDSYLREPVLLAGYASLREPNCSAIEQILTSAQDSFYIQNWPEGLLEAIRVCNQIGWSPFLEKKEKSEIDQLPDWAKMLTQAGLLNEALAVIERDSFPREELVPVLVQLHLKSPGVLTPSDLDFENWLANKSIHDQLIDLLKQLEILEKHQKLDSDFGLYMCNKGYELVINLKEDIELINYWNIAQQLAAHMGKLNEGKKALELLSLGENHPAHTSPDPYWAPGWAWRAVALYRMDEIDLSRAAMQLAHDHANEQIPASRTYGEWTDILFCHVLLNDWRGAFKATDVPQNELVCFDLKCEALELWYLRK